MWSTFPSFTSLKLEDKDEYEKLVSKHAPFSDLSFTTLHVWWNLSEELAIALLNDNVIIDYRNPYDSVNSGLCIVGDNRLAESMQQIFEYQQRRKDMCRLVHVPEFVISSLSATDKKALNIVEELDYNEYILDTKELEKLDNSAFAKMRRKVNRFMREVEGKNLEIRSLDFADQNDRDLMFTSIIDWNKKYPKVGDPEDSEDKAILSSLSNFQIFNLHNICIFVDGELQAVIIYHESHDKKYYIINHLKVAYTIPFIFDYATQLLARHAVENNVPYLNMEMDLGIEGLRRHKMGLRPVEFFRKYTITPVDGQPKALDELSFTD